MTSRDPDGENRDPDKGEGEEREEKREGRENRRRGEGRGLAPNLHHRLTTLNTAF